MKMRPIGVFRAAGFTLIEVIVALSLLAFGLALSFATLRGASKATERAEITSQRGERLRAVQGFLRAQLSGALPIAYAFDSETGGASFLTLGPDKLEFVATMPVPASPSGGQKGMPGCRAPVGSSRAAPASVSDPAAAPAGLA